MTDSAIDQFPEDLAYTAHHDWARIAGAEATLGITWYAQEQLGEIVFWEGAAVGAEVTQEQSYTELESVKAVSEVIAPLSGRIVAINDAALETPDMINESPYERGWLVRIELSSPDEAANLLSADSYRELVER